MGYRNLTNEELINQATAEMLSEDSNIVEVHKDLIMELVERFERVLLSQSSLLAEKKAKDPNQLEIL